MRLIHQNNILQVKKPGLPVAVLVLSFIAPICIAQQTVFYSGKTLSNVDYHHGLLTPVIGVHNIQVMRANRGNPSMSDGFGWTYSHAPNLAYWNNTFYLQYLSDSVGEHIPPSQTLILTSEDGYNWSKPKVVFPPYAIPDGTVKKGVPGVAKNMTAIMHQRMGFYASNDDRLLCLGYYGISMHKRDGPNDGNGIGRVVREIYADGSFSPIYFIRYNKGWDPDKTDYPFYTASDDKSFVDVCDELLANPLMMQQWNEEQDRDDPLIPENKEYKAFCFYHLPDGRTVGLWKHALTSISENGGKSWSKAEVAPGFVTKNAKIWGQKTSDGKYVTVYNPSEFRWPLALSVSDDGLEYTNLLLINGEITTMRYGGNYKSYGPQYVRGIVEGNGTPPDGNLWITYSMNKEDIWVSKVPVPVESTVKKQIHEVFNKMPDGHELDKWNIYSPLWAPVKIEKSNGEKILVLKDSDPFDYAKAERLFPECAEVTIEFTLMAAQNNHGILQVEFQDKRGYPAVRLVFDADSLLKLKNGYRMSEIIRYMPEEDYKIRLELNVKNRECNVFVNDEKKKTSYFFAPVHSLQRIAFRTGAIRYFPNADTPTDQDFDLPHPGDPVEEAVFYIKSLKTTSE